MYDFMENKKYFAQVPGMMEKLCAEELKELGAEKVQPAYRGVYFEADLLTIYRINYTARTISRVLAPLKSFKCRSANDIMKFAATIKWDDFFSVNQTFAITSSINKSPITNSLYASQVLKDGIADYFRSKYTKRPNVETVNPDVRFNLFIEKDKAVLSLDTSGESLHKRGYRLLAGDAPMQETLAAEIIRISGWDGEKPLLDCMCGSGTILCEALMHYCRIPAQYLRTNFGFFHLPGFNKPEWNKFKKEEDSKIRPLPKGIIKGSDKSQQTLKIAMENLSRLPFSENVELTAHPFQHIPEFQNGILITNPPYGIRMGKREEVENLYTELGDFLKQRCNGTTAYIYTGDPSLRKKVGLKTTRRIPLVNGKLEGVLMQIDSYAGSRLKKYMNDGEE